MNASAKIKNRDLSQQFCDLSQLALMRINYVGGGPAVPPLFDQPPGIRNSRYRWVSARPPTLWLKKKSQPRRKRKEGYGGTVDVERESLDIQGAWNERFSGFFFDQVRLLFDRAKKCTGMGKHLTPLWGQWMTRGERRMDTEERVKDPHPEVLFCIFDLAAAIQPLRSPGAPCRWHRWRTESNSCESVVNVVKMARCHKTHTESNLPQTLMFLPRYFIKWSLEIFHLSLHNFITFH